MSIYVTIPSCAESNYIKKEIFEGTYDSLRTGFFVIPIVTDSIEITFFVGIMIWAFVKGNSTGVTNIFITLMIVSCIFDLVKMAG